MGRCIGCFAMDQTALSKTLRFHGDDLHLALSKLFALKEFYHQVEKALAHILIKQWL